MNILFINNLPFNPSLGGIERVTDILTKSLIKNCNHKIFYLSGYVDKKEMLEYDFPVIMHTFPEKGLFNSVNNIKFYCDFIKSNNIDLIINQRGLEFNFDKALDIQSVKKISVLHSTPYAYLKFYSKVFRRPNNIKDFIKNIFKFFMYPIWSVRNKKKAFHKLSEHYNYLSDNSDAIILLSKHYITEFQSFNIKRKSLPIYNIPNPNTYFIPTSEWEDKEKIILFIGRLEQQDKNPLQLIKIWNRLYKNYPDWKLLFVGDGPERNKMQSYIQKKNINNVYFEGNQKNVIDYYRKASFICLTSNYEGWPMVLIEGMTFGCIPFAFNSFGAITDIIDENINGHIVTAFNINEYANKLAYLMDNQIKRKQMSHKAQLKVKEFNANNIIIKWEEVINSL